MALSLLRERSNHFQKVLLVKSVTVLKNEELGYVNPLHNCGFNFVEEVLIEGVKVYSKLLEEFEII
jgi:hypothetical protein